MQTLPPPASTPTTPPFKQGRRWLAVLGWATLWTFIASAAIATAYGVVLWATDDDVADVGAQSLDTPAAPDGQIEVQYSLVVLDESCADVEDTTDDTWGYDDIPGMEFQVRDENDKVIGHGSLNYFGTAAQDGCMFESETFFVDAAALYQVGNPDRGYVTWGADEVADGVLYAMASL